MMSPVPPTAAPAQVALLASATAADPAPQAPAVPSPAATAATAGTPLSGAPGGASLPVQATSTPAVAVAIATPARAPIAAVRTVGIAPPALPWPLLMAAGAALAAVLGVLFGLRRRH